MSQYPPPSRRPDYSQNPYPPADPWSRPAQEQPPEVVYHRLPTGRSAQRRDRRRQGRGCCAPLGCLLPALLGGVLLLAINLLFPARTNLLLLGIDYAPGDSSLSRSDTLILGTVLPLEPYVGMLSIPRDLWVNVPGVGENRINTAHYFAEGFQPGSGPQAALETVRTNFGVDVNYYIRIRFEGFRDVINAMGGVDITLDEPQAGYPAGRHHLTGNKALAFVRSRMGSDDFFRMARGQLLLKAVFRQMLSPLKWPRLPGVLLAFMRATDTNLPIWLWPRLGLAALRAGPAGIDSRSIDRTMAVPFITADGAQVLLPDWAQINPVLMEMFGQ